MHEHRAGATMTDVGCTVLVVDDHAEFRSVARALLESDGFTVVGEAADGTEAIASAQRLRPRLVLLDIALPDIDGFAVADRLAESGLDAPAVVLVSSRAAGAYRRRLATTTARGFISKTDLTGAAVRLLLRPD
jgi:CheY-like chemotaxis protein